MTELTDDQIEKFRELCEKNSNRLIFTVLGRYDSGIILVVETDNKKLEEQKSKGFKPIVVGYGDQVLRVEENVRKEDYRRLEKYFPGISEGLFH